LYLKKSNPQKLSVFPCVLPKFWKSRTGLNLLKDLLAKIYMSRKIILITNYCRVPIFDKSILLEIVLFAVSSVLFNEIRFSLKKKKNVWGTHQKTTGQRS
jgi:hypothetical protein